MKKTILLIILIWQSFHISSQEQIFLQTPKSDMIEDSNYFANLYGSGASLADFDNDGDIDFFLGTEESLPNRLYRNDGNGVFTEIASDVGLDDTDRNRVALWLDYNSDNRLDLIIAGDCLESPDIFNCDYNSRIKLYEQTSDGNFVNIDNTKSGLTFGNLHDDDFNIGIGGLAAGDINNDGYLDLLVTIWGGENFLFLNNGNGSFSDISMSSNIGISVAYNWQGIFHDFDNDGFQDIYLNVDFGANELWINNRDNTFREIAQSAGADSALNEMGLALGDYDNDEDLDVFATNIAKETIGYNLLLKNISERNNIKFQDVSKNSENYKNGWSWGTTFFDANNDGWLDLISTSGGILPDVNKTELLFNNGSGEFLTPIQFDNILKATSILAFDIERDGDLDLLQTLKVNPTTKKPVTFYENQIREHPQQNNNHNYLVIKPRMINTNNHFAVGSVVKIKVGNLVNTRLITAGTSIFGQEPFEAFFGIKDNTVIDELTIEWPNNSTTSLQNISGNQVLTITNENAIVNTDVMGCMDENSCNYNYFATIDDGSCQYFSNSHIVGPTDSFFNKTENYTYTLSTNSKLEWSIEGGELINGQGTENIEVKWYINGSGLGKIQVNEINENCSNQITSLGVKLALNLQSDDLSIARIWNEALLEAIRNDFARPTVHARNLFHSSIVLYDIWAIYEEKSTYLTGNELNGFQSRLESFTSLEPIKDSKEKAMSYAMYRLLSHRFKNSPRGINTLNIFDLIMDQLGYDTNYIDQNYKSGNPADLGNYIAQIMIEYGLKDNSQEVSDYKNVFYSPANLPLDLNSSAPIEINDPNRWQPLTFNTFIDQSGNTISGSTPEFLSPEWGNVYSFALSEENKEVLTKENSEYTVFHNPNTPPKLGGTNTSLYKWNFSLVSIWGSHLDPSDGVIWDISPNSIGNINIDNLPNSYEDYSNFYDELNGGDISLGHDVNPITGLPYEIQNVPRGDYTRVLAEFWADGPNSETPPGHWFTILNYVSDHNQFERRFNGEGEELTPLEWDVKSYFILGGALHDAAIAAWSIKGWHDYIRPISAIRYMASLGQSTDNSIDNYHPDGIPLKTGFVEIVNSNDPLSGNLNENIGKIKIFSWRGHNYINNSETDVAGVGWILAEDWWPYQKPSFVTPPFAGFVSGHSTFSRAAAEVLTLITGSEFFPGGLGEFIARKDEFLEFEKGPSMDVKLQWATYRDASDQTSLSRIWGGIHPPVDDIPGRIIGEQIGKNAYNFAIPYFNSSLTFNDEISTIQVYPNPVNDIIFIENLLVPSTITIFSLDGKVVLYKERENTPNLSQDISKLTSGLYILNVENESQRTNQMIVKR